MQTRSQSSLVGNGYAAGCDAAGGAITRIAGRVFKVGKGNASVPRAR